MKRRIKSKSFSRIKHHNERTKHFFPRVFPFSFVFCLLYLLSRNVSPVFCLPSLRYCYWLQLFSCFSFSVFCFSPPARFVFVSFLSPSPRPHLALISFHSTNIHTNIFQSSNSIHKSHFTSAAAAGACHATRYLNFILMFVPSINFYNPFINLIKTKHTESSLPFVRFLFRLSPPKPFSSGNFYSFSRIQDQLEGILTSTHLLWNFLPQTWQTLSDLALLSFLCTFAM